MSANKGRREIESELIAKAWKDEAFKKELISNPKAVYGRELGQELPKNLTIRVVEETADTIYLALPRSPQVSEELSDEALEAVAGGWHFVTSGVIAGSP
ncbi:Nitrile hydratase alpha/Thiocyanate hydrolase gamma domain-containing protein [Nostoc sp. DSM 114161]|jgi:sugar-specific transcriptional regulator TrmB|uniref:NHLP leader peptide family RiPP precursor n=1 Tax=Nostoc sp. DSM 114161 TaxID=3440143 RepID=UPI004045A4E6